MTARDFILSLATRFNPEAVPGASSVFHFDVTGNGGGKFTASVHEGVCKVEEGLMGEPKCIVTVSDENLVKIVKGELNGQMAVFMGKLKISNLSEMMKFAKPFGLM
jgi:putative sterol carrier protein